MVQAPESAGRAVVFFPCERDDVLAVRAMSFEEFLALDFEGKIAEWVDGEARIYVNATDHHQRVVGFLHSVLHGFCDATGVGVVRLAPYAIRTHPGANSREPDVIFVAEAHRDRLGEQYLEGPPDIVVEVVSPDSVRRDYEEKLAEYAAGGVPEYWIIDPRPGHERAAFYTLEGRTLRAAAGRPEQWSPGSSPGSSFGPSGSGTPMPARSPPSASCSGVIPSPEPPLQAPPSGTILP